MPPGWYWLRRSIVRGSIPPDVLNAEARRNWAHQNQQRMGLFCSIECLARSMERLCSLDATFKVKGIGLKLNPETVATTR